MVRTSVLAARTLAIAVALLSVARGAHAQHDHAMAMPVAGPVTLSTQLGSWSHRVTASAEAQRYFDQGLRLYYAFNHEEATRAFREAARLDPGCAMAWWGVAIAAGPNINMPMDPDHARIANQAMAMARVGAAQASPAERGYIEALATRYSEDSTASRAGLDSAYANAMAAFAKRVPDDLDAQVLHAEAMMDLNPWNQWTHEGAPNPGTLELVAILEGVLKKNPNHPGANHFYIHAVEASPHPERANAAAARLGGLVPGAGHLVHMPSHIYARTGRYDDARLVNEKAVAVDEKYIAEQNPQGVYPLMYYNHNIQFIWFTSCMQGRHAEALEAARKMASHLPPDLVRQMTMLEMAPPYPIMTLARFGRWDDVLAEPIAPPDLHYASAIGHYARGLAFAGKGQPGPARAELDSVRAMAALVPADQIVSINMAAPLLRVASLALEGEIARAAKDPEAAARLLERATTVEDSLHYDEPPTWYYPVRHLYGAALLDARKAAEAEAVYREDLRRHPGNGWSLFGLAQALRAEGKASEAATVDAQFKHAWSGADVKPTSSAF